MRRTISSQRISSYNSVEHRTLYHVDTSTIMIIITFHVVVKHIAVLYYSTITIYTTTSSS